MKNLVDANRMLLDGAAALFSQLDDKLYTETYPAYHSGSIGQHLRHVLDHYRSILDRRDGYIDYDARRRHSRVETCRQTALAEISGILQELPALADEDVLVSSENSIRETVVVHARSTLMRELMFATSHAVHHFALIAMLIRMKGIAVPADFGVAPATLTYLRSLKQ